MYYDRRQQTEHSQGPSWKRMVYTEQDPAKTHQHHNPTGRSSLPKSHACPKADNDPGYGSDQIDEPWPFNKLSVIVPLNDLVSHRAFLARKANRLPNQNASPDAHDGIQCRIKNEERNQSSSASSSKAPFNPLRHIQHRQPKRSQQQKLDNMDTQPDTNSRRQKLENTRGEL